VEQEKNLGTTRLRPGDGDAPGFHSLAALAPDSTYQKRYFDLLWIAHIFQHDEYEYLSPDARGQDVKDKK
jgi:hypothetical protein